MVYEIEICFLGSTTCSPIRFSVVTQHLTSLQIGSEKGFIWKQGNHTRFEYARISLIESVPEQQ